MVLSHEEQLGRLAEGCPEAVSAAVVAGDPCLDELRASRAFRTEYREAWGLLPGQKFVVISSTWSRESQLGSAWEVVGHAVATLPRDEFRVVAVVHPNVWYGHSPWQLRAWMAPLQAAGLTVLRPEGDGWKAALSAADLVVGDYGSVTFYGAALGVPTLLSGLPSDGTLAPDSPIAELLPLLERVDRGVPLVSQVEGAVRRFLADPRIGEVTAKATSVPGSSARILREVFYDTMQLPEPAAPVVVQPVELPDDAVFMEPRRSPVPASAMCAAVVDDDGVRLRRYPVGGAGDRAHEHLVDAHLVAHVGEPDERVRLQADVLISPACDDGDLAWVLRDHPGCWVAARPQGVGAALVVAGNGWRGRVAWECDDPRMTVAAAASAVYALLPERVGAGAVVVRLGSLAVRLSVEVPAE
ncbi:hypothetical protein [Yinghuangia sp. YIM S09857]|uniref:hypothetical protein n=1 Tax=Yinghuangia sp. YIM S09857 TaxID=3436929 RepID=UPI003F52C108